MVRQQDRRLVGRHHPLHAPLRLSKIPFLQLRRDHQQGASRPAGPHQRASAHFGQEPPQEGPGQETERGGSPRDPATSTDYQGSRRAEDSLHR